MSDSPQPESKTTLQQLRSMRQEFADNAKKSLADMDKMIADAEKAEAQQRLAADFSLFLPGDDKAVLKGHDFAFLINNTKGARGPESIIGATIGAAHKVKSTVVGVDGVSVDAKFWGDKYVTQVHLDKGPNAYDVHPAEAKDILPVLKALLLDNAPDQASDAQKHYIIVCDGAITSDASAAGAILAAAAKFNPKATFDFVVCSSATETAIDALVQKSGDANANLVKVAAPAEINAAVMNIIKSRLSGTAYDAPAPKAAAKPAQQSSPSAN
jgi:hypothetical protein